MLPSHLSPESPNDGALCFPFCAPSRSQVVDPAAPIPAPTEANTADGLVAAKSNVFHTVCLGLKEFNTMDLRQARADDNGMLKSVVVMLQATAPGANLSDGEAIGRYSHVLDVI